MLFYLIKPLAISAFICLYLVLSANGHNIANADELLSSFRDTLFQATFSGLLFIHFILFEIDSHYRSALSSLSKSLPKSLSNRNIPIVILAPCAVILDILVYSLYSGGKADLGSYAFLMLSAVFVLCSVYFDRRKNLYHFSDTNEIDHRISIEDWRVKAGVIIVWFIGSVIFVYGLGLQSYESVWIFILSSLVKPLFYCLSVDVLTRFSEINKVEKTIDKKNKANY